MFESSLREVRILVDLSKVGVIKVEEGEEAQEAVIRLITSLQTRRNCQIRTNKL